MALTFELGITSADAVTLYPEYDYKAGSIQIKTKHRTKSGKLYLYKWGDYVRVQFSANYIPIADAVSVNGWWLSNTKLLLFITSETATDVFSVVLMNNNAPFEQYNKPYADKLKGKVLLEGY